MTPDRRCRERFGLGRLALFAFVGLLPAGTVRGQDADGTVLWDTRSVAENGRVDFGCKAGWQKVAPGATNQLSGDVVVENERVTVVCTRQSAGPVVCANPVLADGRESSRLVSINASGEWGRRLSDIQVDKNEDDQVALVVTARTDTGQEISAKYTLTRGQPFLECQPVQNADRLRVENAARFVVIPDFFGADMVYDPRAYPQSQLVIPPENFMLSLIEGERTIVMTVWPTGEQEAKLALSGSAQARRIADTEITFQGKSIFVAVLHAPGIWHEQQLAAPYTDQDLSLGWRRPFPAKWRANFCRQRQSDSWDFQDRRTETWMYLYQAIVWPCWFDGEDGFVRLSKRFINVKGPMDFVLVYPSDRQKSTSLGTFTPVDIVRNTLGVGPCEYVLDREGLQGRSANTGRKNFGRGVCDTTTPIEYLFMTGMQTRESALVGHLVDDILADITAIHARVLEFRALAKELRGVVSSVQEAAAASAPLLAQVEKTATEIEDRYQEKLPTIKNPTYAAKVGNRIKALAANPEPENLGECKTLTRDLRDIAGTQHLMVGDYRVTAKRLRQEAAIYAAQTIATAKLAEQVRKVCGQVLRRKYGVEAD
jgi:hypothetical protein